MLDAAGLGRLLGTGRRSQADGLPTVLKSMKHTQVSALRDDGLPVDDILEQRRRTSPEMMARYDRESDRRRDKVGSVLAELVDKAKS